jgi:hypothetical protein
MQGWATSNKQPATRPVAEALMWPVGAIPCSGDLQVARGGCGAARGDAQQTRLLNIYQGQRGAGAPPLTVSLRGVPSVTPLIFVVVGAKQRDSDAQRVKELAPEAAWMRDQVQRGAGVQPLTGSPRGVPSELFYFKGWGRSSAKRCAADMASAIASAFPETCPAGGVHHG